MLRLLENPVLLEHEAFTDVLRTVFHLIGEMDKREDLTAPPAVDREHLGGDINRVYGLIVVQRLDDMHYLKQHYSLSLITGHANKSLR